MASKINKSKIITYSVALYITILFTAGQISTGILYSDLFIPIFFFLILRKFNKISKDLVLIISALILYALIISYSSILLQANSLFLAFALLMRFIVFCGMLIFGSIYYENIINGIKFFSPIILISVLYVTLINYLGNTKAYYSYIQIPSTYAPAQSSLTLSALGMFIFIFGFYPQIKNKQNILYGLGFTLLGLLTFTLSAFASIIFTFFVIFFIFIIKDKTRLFFKKKYWAIFLFTIFLFTLFFEEFLSFFWRVNYFIFNLEFRLNKVAENKVAMCQNIGCLLFGTGLGSHSFFSNAILGETAILAFDQLQGRILLEWGLFGSGLWILLILKLIFYNKNLISFPIIIFILFGFLFGFGSEFIFENYSGQLYGLLLGAIYGFFMKQYNYKNNK
jgi:hypothetical protein